VNVLKTRGNMYGSFDGIAILSQSIKSLMGLAYENADEPTREALDMIIHKLARVGSNPDGWKLQDNATDIAGYAKLWEQHLNGVEGAVKTKVKYEKVKK